MRKRIIDAEGGVTDGDSGDWLDLEPLAAVEISSEDPSYPIEAALRREPGPGWRAASPGTQVVRLVFDRPQELRRIRLVFVEQVHQRTQEFVLRWSDDGGRSYRDVLRQQYSFSPPGTVEQVEEYRVELRGVTALELQIIPELSGRPLLASLAALRLA